MSLWNKAGKKPHTFDRIAQRNVIATPKGWVRRINYTSHDSVARSKEEVLVAIGELDEELTMGNPDISDIYVANSTGGTHLAVGDVLTVNVVYTEPVTVVFGSDDQTISVANTISGNAVIAVSAADANTIVNANNTLVFSFVAGAAGTYKVEAQTIANTANAGVYSIYSVDEAANTSIGPDVSNTNGTFVIV